MKNSFKFAALALTFAAFSIGAKAQSTTTTTTTTTQGGVRYSIGVDGGLPTGKLSDSYNWSLGGSIQADIPVAHNLFVTVNAGYNNFFGKNIIVPGNPAADVPSFNAKAPNIELLPVKAGLKYFLVPNFYIQGEAGAAFVLNKSKIDANNSAAFVYAPQLGYQFQLGGGNYIDAGIRYEASTKLNSSIADSKVNFAGLRIAYGF